MEDLNKFFQNKRNIVNLLIFLILILAVPIVLNLVRQQQILRSRASVPGVNFVGSQAGGAGDVRALLGGKTGLVVAEGQSAQVGLLLLSSLGGPGGATVTPGGPTVTVNPNATATPAGPTRTPTPSPTGPTRTPTRTPTPSPTVPVGGIIYKLSENSTFPTGAATKTGAYDPNALIDFTLSGGNGPKTVWAQFFRNEVALPPLGPAFSRDIVLNQGSAVTNTPVPAPQSAATVELKLESTDWQSYTYDSKRLETTVPFNLGSGDGTKTVFARFKDANGQILGSTISRQITLQTQGSPTATPTPLPAGGPPDYAAVTAALQAAGYPVVEVHSVGGDWQEATLSDGRTVQVGGGQVTSRIVSTFIQEFTGIGIIPNGTLPTNPTATPTVPAQNPTATPTSVQTSGTCTISGDETIGVNETKTYSVGSDITCTGGTDTEGGCGWSLSIIPVNFAGFHLINIPATSIDLNPASIGATPGDYNLIFAHTISNHWPYSAISCNKPITIQ